MLKSELLSVTRIMTVLSILILCCLGISTASGADSFAGSNGTLLNTYDSRYQEPRNIWNNQYSVSNLMLSGTGSVRGVGSASSAGFSFVDPSTQVDEGQMTQITLMPRSNDADSPPAVRLLLQAAPGSSEYYGMHLDKIWGGNTYQTIEWTFGADSRSSKIDISNFNFDKNQELTLRLVITYSADQSTATLQAFAANGSNSLQLIATFQVDGVNTPILTGKYPGALFTAIDNNGTEPFFHSFTDGISFSGGVSNQAPTANAGPNQIVMTGASVSLDGSGSFDSDNNPQPLTFRWVQTSGPSVSLQNTNTSIAHFTANNSGTYNFELTVSDGELVDTASVQIIVPDDIDDDGMSDSFELSIISANIDDTIETLADVLPEDDFNNNGISNLMEYALFIDPNMSNQVPSLPFITKNNSAIRFNLQIDQTRLGLIYQVMYSNDLLSWQEVARSENGNPFIATENSTTIIENENGSMVEKISPDGFFRLHVDKL